MIVILMGVSGSGKTTVGKHLAYNLGWQFVEGDDFHLIENIEKIKQGIALNDEERKEWLKRLRQRILELVLNNQSAIIACSALKQAYRHYLLVDEKVVVFVYLRGNYNLIRHRMEMRQDHFMKANHLPSQFNALEELEDVLTVDITKPPAVIANIVAQKLELKILYKHFLQDNAD
ncbi:MAG TPA: gluconokinase [Candidatus Wujingus californicus]|uniref:gluconokinase n=1 Tax=Candidatus Wujingus californicus TaxID=3367618 RepID=UPI0040251DB0